MHRPLALAALNLDGGIGLFPTRRHQLRCRLLSGSTEQLFLGSGVDTRFALERVQPQILQQCAYRLGNLFLKFFLPVISTARSGPNT